MRETVLHFINYFILQETYTSYTWPSRPFSSSTLRILSRKWNCCIVGKIVFNGGWHSNKRCLGNTVCNWKLSRKFGISSRFFRRHSRKNFKLPEVLTTLSHVSPKILWGSRFPAKCSDSRKNFVFLPKQAFLELSPPVYFAAFCDILQLIYNAVFTLGRIIFGMFMNKACFPMKNVHIRKCEVVSI